MFENLHKNKEQLKAKTLKITISNISEGDEKKPKREDDLQIINEIPGKSFGNRPGTSSLSSLFNPGNLFNSPSLLAAQDPFFALNAAMQSAAGGSSSNTMDLLQKCKFLSE